MKALVSIGIWRKEVDIKPEQLRGGEIGVVLPASPESKIRATVILHHTGFTDGMPVFECK